MPTTKLLDKIYACNLVMWIRINISLHILPKIERKWHISTIFNLKLIIAYSLCILSVIVKLPKFHRAVIHYDVMETSYEDRWYFLVSNERRDQQYILVADIRVKAFNHVNRL